ncbi:putative WD40 repeat [Frankia sp. Hr75.2]|nr:putative WD40 repeat [Frankia sp. Hr75.2]
MAHVESRQPRILVSYSSGSDAYFAMVEKLIHLLERKGIDVVWDVYAGLDGPDWQRWMDEQIAGVDFIVVLGSARYLEASSPGFEHPGPEGRGRGAYYEWTMIRRLRLTPKQFQKRVLPVLLPGHKAAELPQEVHDDMLFIYRIKELTLDGIDELRRRILGDPLHVPSAPDGEADGRSRRELRAEAGEMAKEFTRALRTFRGRHKAMEALARWLRDPDDRLSRFVTGEPGAGKTAMLGLIAHLTTGHAEPVAEAVLRGLPDACLPPENAIDVALSARGKDAAKILDLLEAAVGMPPAAGPADDIETRVQALVVYLRKQSRRITVLLDALDEVSPPTAGYDGEFPPPADLAPLCEDLLAPLVNDSDSPIRFLLGTRRNVLPLLGVTGLGPQGRVIDLSGDYQDLAALRELLETSLLAGDSAWLQASEADVRVVLDVLFEKAGGSFQVGEIIAEDLARQDRLPEDVRDEVWQAGIASTAGEAMYDDLGTRLGNGADRAIGLLLPLAYGRGSGIPWGEVWLPLANALRAPETPEYADSDLDLIRRHASSYVVEGPPDARGRTLFRLHHREFSDYLRARQHEDGRDSQTADEQMITRTLIEGIPAKDHGRDWAWASTYVRRHLLEHAIAGARQEDLEDLVFDPGFLANAAEAEVRSALGKLTEPRHRAVADAYAMARTAASRVQASGDRDDTPLLLAQLSLAARCHGAPALADNVPLGADPRRAPWRAKWAAWRQQPPLTLLADHSGQVGVVATASLAAGDTAALTGGVDGVIRVCDVLTGAALMEIPAHRGPVLGLATGAVRGSVVVVSTGADLRARVWDLASGRQIGRDFTLHRAQARAVAVVDLALGPRVLTGDVAGVLHQWDPATGRLKAREQKLGASGITALAPVTAGDQVFVLAAHDDGSIGRLTLASKLVLRNYAGTGTRPVRALAVTELDRRPVVVSGGDSGELQVWDPAADPEHGPLRTEAPIRHDRGIRALAGTCVGGMPAVLSVGNDNTARVWNLQDGNQIGAPFAGETGNSLRGLATVEASNRSLAVLIASSARPVVWELTPNGAVNEPFSGHKHQVRSLLFTKIDGRNRLVSGSSDATVRRWDPDNGGQTGAELTGHRRGWVGALAAVEVAGEAHIYSAGADKTVLGWNAATGKQVGAVSHDWPVAALLRTAVDGRPWLVSATLGGSVCAWDVGGGTDPRAYTGHGTTAVRALAETWSESGDPLVVSGGDSADLHVWQPATGARVNVWAAGHAVTALATVAARANLVVSGGTDGRVLAHDLRSRRPVRLRPEGPAVTALQLAVLDDTTVLVTAHEDGSVRLSDVDSPADVVVHLGHGGQARALAIGEANGRWVAFSAGDDHLIKVWDLHDKAPVHQMHRGRVWAVAAVPASDPARIDVLSAGDDDTIQVRALDLSPGGGTVSERRREVRVLSAHHRGVRALATGQVASGVVLVSGGIDRSLRIRDLPSGRLLRQLPGHGDWVRAVATGSFPGPGPVAVSASGDGLIGVWDLERRALIGPLRPVHTDGVRALCLAEVTLHGTETPVIVSGDVKGKILVTQLTGGATVGQPFMKERAGAGDGVRALAATRLDGQWVIVSGYAGGDVLAWDIATRTEAGRVPSSGGEINAIAAREGIDGFGCAWVAVAAGRTVTLSSWMDDDGGWQQRARIEFGCDVLDLAIVPDESDDLIPGMVVVGATQGVVVLEFAKDL